MPKLLRKSNNHQMVILFERFYDTVFENVVILKVWISIKEIQNRNK